MLFICPDDSNAEEMVTMFSIGNRRGRKNNVVYNLKESETKSSKTMFDCTIQHTIAFWFFYYINILSTGRIVYATVDRRSLRRLSFLKQKKIHISH